MGNRQDTFDSSVENNRLHYEFEIKQKITIIRGDSATGKTMLVNMLRQTQKFGASSGIDLICEVPCKILEGENWKLILENAADTIFFIDNGNAFVNTEEFAEAVKKSNSYFVLITRENLHNLPYRVDEIYRSYCVIPFDFIVSHSLSYLIIPAYRFLLKFVLSCNYY